MIVADHPGMCESVVVVGRSRVGRYIRVTIKVWWLHQFRAKLIYSPAVLRKAGEGSSRWTGSTTEAEAEARAGVYATWVSAERARLQSKGKSWVVGEE